jgi:phosphonoacetaldehyde hydrolase
MIKAVILDWAGTSVDFGSLAPVEALLETFSARGMEITENEARESMGLAKIDHIRKILSIGRISEIFKGRYDKLPEEEDVYEFYKDFQRVLRKTLLAHIEPIEGVADVVSNLRDIGIKIGSTTGYSRKIMDILAPLARTFGYEPDAVVTPDDVPCGRPAPYMIFRNIEQLGSYPPESVVKVGDTAADIDEGLNAGVWSVGVAVGSNAMGLSRDEYASLGNDEAERLQSICADRFNEAGANYAIKSIHELPELIKYINERLMGR